MELIDRRDGGRGQRPERLMWKFAVFSDRGSAIIDYAPHKKSGKERPDDHQERSTSEEMDDLPAVRA